MGVAFMPEKIRWAMENRVQKMVNYPAYTPAQAAMEAQEEADRLLAPYLEKTALRFCHCIALVHLGEGTP
jgi:hypothetical protein